MAATGNSFETPRACPFVALELDRDKRADRPDYRHRCFAEPTPAPRSIAHQEAYCLSPNFAACPIFQDWAVRAAARPAATGPAAAGAGTVVASTAGAATAADLAATAAAPNEDARDIAAPRVAGLAPASADLPEDVSMTAADAQSAAAAAAATGMAAAPIAAPTFATTWDDEEPDSAQQLGAFDAGRAADEQPASSGNTDWAAASAGAYVPPPAQPSSSSAPNDRAVAAGAAAPAFLAGRSSRPPTPVSSAPGSAPPSRAPSREEIVPSWQVDNRYGAELPHDPGDNGGGSRMDGILTAIAVIAILAIGVAAVLFLPGLLNKGSGTKTPQPSFSVPSGLPTIAPTLIASLQPTIAPSVAPSVNATTPPSVAPVGSPRTYRIKPGDSLARIAKKFDTTVEEILAANPQITDPNNILVGQVILVPQSSTASPVESASP